MAARIVALQHHRAVRHFIGLAAACREVARQMFAHGMYPGEHTRLEMTCAERRFHLVADRFPDFLAEPDMNALPTAAFMSGSARKSGKRSATRWKRRSAQVISRRVCSPGYMPWANICRATSRHAAASPMKCRTARWCCSATMRNVPYIATEIVASGLRVGEASAQRPEHT